MYETHETHDPTTGTSAAQEADLDAGLAPIEEARYGVRVHGMNLLVPAGVHTEVLAAPRVHVIPNAAPWLAGLVNLRGNLVPVFDLGSLAGVGTQASGGGLVLVVGTGVQALGIHVDSLPSTLRGWTVRDTGPALPESLRTHAGLTLGNGGEHWTELDLAALFGARRDHRRDVAAA